MINLRFPVTGTIRLSANISSINWGQFHPYKALELYETCIESALIISPLNSLANSSESFVFPVPVAPKITTNGDRQGAAIVVVVVLCSSANSGTLRVGEIWVEWE